MVRGPTPRRSAGTPPQLRWERRESAWGEAGMAARRNRRPGRALRPAQRGAEPPRCRARTASSRATKWIDVQIRLLQSR